MKENVNNINIPLYFDKRYFITKQENQQKYIGYFCGIPLHKEPLSLLSCVMKCKSHNDMQELRASVI